LIEVGEADAMAQSNNILQFLNENT